MLWRFLTVGLAGLLLCSGCRSPHEAVAGTVLSVLENMAFEMEQIQDAASAQAAAPRIEAQIERLKATTETIRNLPPASQAESERITKLYKERIDTVSRKLGEESRRVSRDPAMSEPLQTSMFNLMEAMFALSNADAEARQRHANGIAATPGAGSAPTASAPPGPPQPPGPPGPPASSAPAAGIVANVPSAQASAASRAATQPAIHQTPPGNAPSSPTAAASTPTAAAAPGAAVGLAPASTETSAPAGFGVAPGGIPSSAPSGIAGPVGPPPGFGGELGAPPADAPEFVKEAWRRQKEAMDRARGGDAAGFSPSGGGPRKLEGADVAIFVILGATEKNSRRVANSITALGNFQAQQTMQSGMRFEMRVQPVADVRKLAGQIDFGRVVSIDDATRTITLSVHGSFD